MTQAPSIRPEQLAPREVIAFPRVEEFYDLLQYRLNMAMSGFVFKQPFTILINALPRTRTQFIDRYSKVNLIYAGIPRQRQLLNELTYRKADPRLDGAWNFLDNTNVDTETAVVSSQLYDAFRADSYRLEDIPRVGMGTLKDYFAPIRDRNSQRQPTARQKAEYRILSRFFNIDEDLYVSLPLVLFGEFDGIMHFVYSKRDDLTTRKHVLGNIIRSSSAMIETQILEWDLVGRNPEKSKVIMMPLEEDFYKNVNRNPILRELGFREYYRKYLGFYQKRISFNDDVIHSKVYRPYLKAAITAIMIDSFAHNVSAHSLVALNWWFKQRAENLRLQEKEHDEEVAEFKDAIEEYIPEGFERDRIYELIRPWLDTVFVREADPEYDLVNFPGPLAREIQPLIKFLMQKGAFWSGIARDNNFGGESISAYDVLWNDFINNPLYLGTIAKSEAIHRIRFRVIVYEPIDLNKVDAVFPERRRKQPIVDDIFVEVNLRDSRSPFQKDESGARYFPLPDDGGRIHLQDCPELDEMSDFVSPGAGYEVIKKALKDCHLFFPGEVVGRHAFFTLLENKIRNVKHFKGEALRKMQTEGLELCLSFQERPVRVGEIHDSALYSVGVWLNGLAKFRLNDGRLLPHIRYNGLSKGIMDAETFAPRLGGSSQDKLCAAMLFNNYFLSVQNGDKNPMRERSDDTERDKAFYPWLIPVAAPAEDMHEDVVFAANDEVDWMRIDEQFEAKVGYFKKFFHIWKAADIHWVRSAEDTDFVWDNLARFKFVGLLVAPPKMQDLLYDQVRSEGVLRVIKQHLDPNLPRDTALLEAYQYWTRQWMGETSNSIRLFVDNALVGQFIYTPKLEPALKYYPIWELDKKKIKRLPETTIVQDLHLAHGGDTDNVKLLRYRNHGVYVKYFRSVLKPNQPLDDRAQARMAEFFEVLTTRITIFDSRVYHRLGTSDRRDTLAKQLLLHIYDETKRNKNNQTAANWMAHWEENREWIIRTSHFVVLHLSFIEKILLAKYADHPDHGDENIGLFIQEEIIPYATDETGEVRDNFVLVITTGRGRTKWWTRLVEDPNYAGYRRFTNFRPVESIVSAIEDAVNRRDDLEVKYNLVKVMFGS